eukprot:NODE_125_length_17255_cov_0.877827.p4 type:complete len:331 gc:universal NODE_125_length_17255_cov_0.877827:11862-12854(+)
MPFFNEIKSERRINLKKSLVIDDIGSFEDLFFICADNTLNFFDKYGKFIFKVSCNKYGCKLARQFKQKLLLASKPDRHMINDLKGRKKKDEEIFALRLLSPRKVDRGIQGSFEMYYFGPEKEILHFDFFLDSGLKIIAATDGDTVYFWKDSDSNCYHKIGIISSFVSFTTKYFFTISSENENFNITQYDFDERCMIYNPSSSRLPISSSPLKVVQSKDNLLVMTKDEIVYISTSRDFLKFSTKIIKTKYSDIFFPSNQYKTHTSVLDILSDKRIICACDQGSVKILNETQFSNIPDKYKVFTSDCKFVTANANNRSVCVATPYSALILNL